MTKHGELWLLDVTVISAAGIVAPQLANGYHLLLGETDVLYAKNLKKVAGWKIGTTRLVTFEVLAGESRLTITRLAMLGLAGLAVPKNRTLIAMSTDTGSAALLETRVGADALRGWLNRYEWARRFLARPA